jgi:hypothetical protein
MLIRQNAVTGAPNRSDPKLGKAWATFPSRNAADASNSAAVTTPCPPRPWIRISIIDKKLSSFGAYFTQGSVIEIWQEICLFLQETVILKEY